MNKIEPYHSSLFVYSAATPRTYSAEENSFRLMLNALCTYRVLGQADIDVVAALTPAALDTCLALRLPSCRATTPQPTPPALH